MTIRSLNVIKLILLFIGYVIISNTVFADTNKLQPANAEAIDWVWSGQRVWFDFDSKGNYQMIAYYDAARQMSVAVREMGDVNGGPWIYHKLPSYLGWDAHNKVEAAFDSKGYIHVVGNLHANPLVYFRSTEPYNPRTLVKVDVMVSQAREQQMTYPSLFLGNDKNLYFKYRLGTSNKGRWYYNRWDVERQQWSALHDSTLLDGEDVRSVYPYGPVFGPDGYAHLVFVWRENPKASSNHDLSYARSKDLNNWETSSGEPISLPIKLNSGEVVDAIPMHGGLLNGNTPLGFDRNNNPLITYQKYDNKGNSQVFLSRRDKSGWQTVQISHWQDFRVDLDKSGALDLPLVTTKATQNNADGNIIVSAVLSGVAWEWLVDGKTLTVLNGGTVDKSLPTAITQFDINNNIPLRVKPMMVEQITPSKEFFISWEAMQPNRDQARENIPPPSTLRVHKLSKKQ